MKEIFLTQGKVALVDDEDFERLNQFKWQAVKNGKTIYGTRSKQQCIIYMHHEIIGKPPKGFETDHGNGNGLDNQRYNLKFVTHRQNCQNKKNGKKKTSQYPGVCWKKRTRKWQVGIQINGKNKHLGYFVDEKKAFEVYEQAVKNIGETIINN